MWKVVLRRTGKGGRQRLGNGEFAQGRNSQFNFSQGEKVRSGKQPSRAVRQTKKKDRKRKILQTKKEWASSLKTFKGPLKGGEVAWTIQEKRGGEKRLSVLGRKHTYEDSDQNLHSRESRKRGKRKLYFKRE